MISIVTPVFNGAAHLPRTLESMAGQSAQFEHLVMDAGSTDNTVALAGSFASRYDLRVISEPDEGLYDAVQKGFSKTCGDVLGWLNAGDAYLGWTLHTVERVFSQHPEVEWITGVPCLYYERARLFAAAQFTPIYLREPIRRGWHDGDRLAVLQQESMFWRRSLWERSGGADVLKGNGRRRGLASDYHLWRRFAAHAKLHTVCSPLAAFTISPGQISEKHRAAYCADMGVRSPNPRPNRGLMLLFRLHSLLMLRSSINVESLAALPA
jgi:glycosyltransferase involved in cell wall biosynthesis